MDSIACNNWHRWGKTLDCQTVYGPRLLIWDHKQKPMPPRLKYFKFSIDSAELIRLVFETSAKFERSLFYYLHRKKIITQLYYIICWDEGNDIID